MATQEVAPAYVPLTVLRLDYFYSYREVPRQSFYRRSYFIMRFFFCCCCCCAISQSINQSERKLNIDLQSNLHLTRQRALNCRVYLTTTCTAIAYSPSSVAIVMMKHSIREPLPTKLCIGLPSIRIYAIVGFEPQN